MLLYHNSKTLMGNHRFKLSDMMPNAWFYKLRDMGKPKTRNPKNRPPSTQNPPRKSYYHSSESRLTHNPKSTKKRSKQKTIFMPSPNHRVSDSLSDEGSELRSSDDELLSSYRCKTATDIIIDVDQVSYGAVSVQRFTEFDMISEQDLNLPPILTKPTKNKNLKKNVGSAPRKSVSRSGVKVRIRGNQGRRSCEKKAGVFRSESLAIVKASVDPERDFRDSMLEMIAENNIRESKDLEDLLACYLSLNSNQYHGVIIKAFEQIWLERT